MATNKSSAQKELIARRARQMEEINTAITGLETQGDALSKKIAHHSLLTSVANGLYEELDKLTKKAPADLITSLALAQINDVIADTKQLCQGDAYVQRQVEFVPAGDNPEHRDALVVLSQIRQGLQRFGANALPESERVASLLKDAKGVKIALQLLQAGHDPVSEKIIESYGESLSGKWLYYSGGSQCVSFTVLDRTSIPAYFR